MSIWSGGSWATCASSTAASWTTTWPCWPSAFHPWLADERPAGDRAGHRCRASGHRARDRRGAGGHRAGGHWAGGHRDGGHWAGNLASARDRVVNKIDPAAFRTSQLGIAYLNQETGVRGYALSARPTFLIPYQQGRVQEQREVSALRPLLTGMPAAQADLTQVTIRA